MEVRMLSPMADDNVLRNVGDTVTVGDEEGADLIAAGHAEPLELEHEMVKKPSRAMAHRVTKELASG